MSQKLCKLNDKLLCKPSTLYPTAGLTLDLLTKENSSLNDKLAPLVSWLFCEPNPIGLNTALSQLGLIRPVFRLPYVPLPISKREEFVRIVNDIGLEHFSGAKEVKVMADEDFHLITRMY